MKRLAIYCADIGSVKEKNFGWARRCQADVEIERGSRESISDLANELAKDLERGYPVALGFECPLFVPVTDDPIFLTTARDGDGSRPWSAGAGAACLTTGLSETVWILDRVKGLLRQPITVHLSWPDFREAESGLFLWEAFVTADAKRDTHVEDATAAVDYFYSLLPDVDSHNAIKSERVRSLIGAAVLQAKFSSDLKLLETPCLVLKVKGPTKPEAT
jgi:hypothetical protein